MAAKQKASYKPIIKYLFCCICSPQHQEILVLLFLLFLSLHTVASTTCLMQCYITQHNLGSSLPGPVTPLQLWLWQHFNAKLLVSGICRLTMKNVLFGLLTQSFCLQMYSEAEFSYFRTVANKEIKQAFVASNRCAYVFPNPKCLWALQAGL